MRREILSNRSFLEGFVLAFAVLGVTFCIIGTVRRMRAWTGAAHAPPIAPIDGVYPPEAASLDARPQEEANGPHEPLESEAVDVPLNSQRWV